MGNIVKSWCVCVAVVLGVWLRMEGAGWKSFSKDEVLAVSIFSRPYSEILRELQGRPFPPLYYIGLHAWTCVAGLSDISARLPALVFGLLALPTTYFAWRPIIGCRAASWALALLALNAFHIWYSDEAKMYSLVWLLSTVSSAMYLRLIFGPYRSWRLKFAYIVSTACLPLVSYVGFAPLMVQAVYSGVLLWSCPARRRQVFNIGLMGLAALMPFACWLPVASEVMVHRVGIRWIPLASGDIFTDISQMFGGLFLGYRTLGTSYPEGLWWTGLKIMFAVSMTLTALMLVGSLLAVFVRRESPRLESEQTEDVGGVECLPDEGREASTVYLALWLLLPLVEVWVFSLSVYTLWGIPRHFSAVAPAATLWLASSIGSLRSVKFFPMVGLLVILGNLMIIGFDRSHYTRVPWREINDKAQAFATTIAYIKEERGINNRERILVKVPMVFDYTNMKLTFESIAHANRKGTRQVQFVETMTAERREGREPFFILSRYRGQSRSKAEQAREGSAVYVGYTPCWICSYAVYQDKFSTTADPFDESTVDLWIYYPSPRR